MRKQQIIILGIVFGISLLGLIILQTSYFQTAYEVKKEQFFYSANRAMDDMVDYIRKQEEAGRLSENRNLSEARSRGVEIDAPIYIDPKRPIAVKNDPSAVANSMLNLIDDDSEVKDVSEFVGSKFKEDNLATSISKLQQAMKERTGENYRFVPEGKEDKHVIEGRVDLNNLYGFIGNTLTDAGIRSRFEFGIKENGKFILTSKNFLSHVSDDVTLSRKIFPGESSSAILYLKFPDASSDTAGSVWMVLPGVLITIAIVFCAVFCLIVIVRQKKLSVIKNDFINNMTHEFKTPIATISLASQMLKDGAVTNTPETIDRVATIIRDESKRLTFQVERVLQTALFTETRMKLKLKNININQLIEDLLPKFSLRRLLHAETDAINNACKALGGWRLWNCEIYVTLEPCPMCAGAIINAHIPTVYFGAYDFKNGSCGTITNLFEMPYNFKPNYKGGIMQEECAELLKSFFKRLR